MLGVIFGKTTHPRRYVKAHAHVGVQGSRNRLRRPGAEANYTYFLVLKEQYFPSLVFARGAFRWLLWKKGQRGVNESLRVLKKKRAIGSHQA